MWLGDLEVQNFYSAGYCPGSLASELFSGGLLATCICHPAGPKGCTTAAHLLLRSDLAFSRRTFSSVVSTVPVWWLALVARLLIFWRRKKKKKNHKDLIAFLQLVPGSSSHFYMTLL
jgi:hypothetical protein